MKVVKCGGKEVYVQEKYKEKGFQIKQGKGVRMEKGWTTIVQCQYMKGNSYWEGMKCCKIKLRLGEEGEALCNKGIKMGKFDNKEEQLLGGGIFFR